jgi:hypothetical protein
MMNWISPNDLNFSHLDREFGHIGKKQKHDRVVSNEDAQAKER